jgi:hypothetical protein
MSTKQRQKKGDSISEKAVNEKNHAKETEEEKTEK